MSSRLSGSRKHTTKKATTLWIAALMMLVGMLMGASPALASTAGTAQAGSHHPTAPAVSRIASAGRYSVPNIQEQPCTSGRATWVHIKTLEHGTQCYGFTGTWYFSGNVLISFCPGNNRGTFWYSDSKGQEHSFNFEPGGATVGFMTGGAVKLYISGWEGNYKC
jgi:hypothetical protein